MVAIALGASAVMPAQAQVALPQRADRSVHDLAGVLSAQTVPTLERFHRELFAKTGVAIVVITVPTLDGEPVSDFAVRVGEEWGVGRQGEGRGIVVALAVAERDIFIEVANARSRLAGAASPAEAANANAGLTGALGRLLAIAENYPQLRSNENFIRLQDELAGSENRIAVERRRYNDAVRDFNSGVQQFPNNLMAGMFGFAPRE